MLLLAVGWLAGIAVQSACMQSAEPVIVGDGDSDQIEGGPWLDVLNGHVLLCLILQLHLGVRRKVEGL